MQEDNKGWDLLSFKIVGYKGSDSTAKVRIAFTERSNSFGVIDITEDTQWEKIGDEWFCAECGVRTHLSMNASLVIETR